MPRQIEEARVFDAVVELWVREGYAGTTTKAIAANAGVNEATLFRRYGGKAELVRVALVAQLEGVPLRTLAATDDLGADLSRVVEGYLETYRQIGAVFPLLLIEVARHPELRPALGAAWTNVGALLEIVAHHQARGALREEPPLLTMLSLIGPLFVIGLVRQAQPDLPVEVNVEAHVQAFLHGRAAAGS